MAFNHHLNAQPLQGADTATQHPNPCGGRPNLAKLRELKAMRFKAQFSLVGECYDNEIFKSASILACFQNSALIKSNYCEPKHWNKQNNSDSYIFKVQFFCNFKTGTLFLQQQKLHAFILRKDIANMLYYIWFRVTAGYIYNDKYYKQHSISIALILYLLILQFKEELPIFKWNATCKGLVRQNIL